MDLLSSSTKKERAKILESRATNRIAELRKVKMAAGFQVILSSCGACLHLLYLSSIFYIYFKSPILPGLNSVNVHSASLANRLVLFVTDGLRADKLFHRNNANISHFLRQIIKNEGRWGVSHTRVPTESRVGHVSMMAGTYEDVSAITNGKIIINNFFPVVVFIRKVAFFCRHLLAKIYNQIKGVVNK